MVSTPQRVNHRLRAAHAVPFAFSCAIAARFIACAGSAPRSLPIGATLIAVVTPPSESDPSGILVDGVVQHGRWYCSGAPAPQVYEVMYADGTLRPIRAVGFVPANVGPDGVGPVRVRVQVGHGVIAEGQTYRARPEPGHPETLHVIVLPRAVTGDHVVLTFERRSRFATAFCLGEITAWGDEYPRDGSVITEARPEEQPARDGAASSSPPPSEAQGSTSP